MSEAGEFGPRDEESPLEIDGFTTKYVDSRLSVVVADAPDGGVRS